jgi:hypothetical protein
MFIGACKMYRHNIGALPVGLKGKLYGQPFKVLVQYDAFGGVRTLIFFSPSAGSRFRRVLLPDGIFNVCRSIVILRVFSDI